MRELELDIEIPVAVELHDEVLLIAEGGRRARRTRRGGRQRPAGGELADLRSRIESFGVAA